MKYYFLRFPCFLFLVCSILSISTANPQRVEETPANKYWTTAGASRWDPALRKDLNQDFPDRINVSFRMQVVNHLPGYGYSSGSDRYVQVHGFHLKHAAERQWMPSVKLQPHQTTAALDKAVHSGGWMDISIEPLDFNGTHSLRINGEEVGTVQFATVNADPTWNSWGESAGITFRSGGAAPAATNRAASGRLGDVDNNSRVDIADALLVAMYSANSSIRMPNGGDISLGDVNCDGRVNSTDAWLIATYSVNPSDSVLPSGIGQVGGCGNAAPVARGRIPDQLLKVGAFSTVDVSAYFTDPDGDRLTYTARSSRTGVATERVSGSRVTITAVSDGTATVTVTARDPGGLTAQRSRVTITAVSDGTATVTVTARDPGGLTAQQRITVRVDPTVSLNPLPDFDITVAPNRRRVEICVYDHGREDHDRVRVSVNGVVGHDGEIFHAHSCFEAAVNEGSNRLEVFAYNEGDYSPNTAGFIIRGINEETAEWQLNADTGSLSHINITLGAAGGVDHGNTRAAATRITTGSPTTGELSPSGDVDYFRVTVNGSGTLTAHTTGSVDTDGYLENSAGAVLAQNDDSGPGANFRISESVSSGTYYIRVRGWGNATGSYTLHVSIEGTSPQQPQQTAGKMYWVDQRSDKIQRANLDGSNVEDLVTGLASPRRLALDVAAGKMYWADSGGGKIQRANLNGSNVESLVTGLETPVGIALDVAAGKMYWADSGGGKIQRANLNGSNVESLVTGLGNPDGIALDIAGGKIYWTDVLRDKIQRANLNGSNVEDLVTGLAGPLGLALDVAGGKMYWADWLSGKIQRANLNGSNVEDLVTGLDRPIDVALDVAAGKMYWTDPGRDKIQRANLNGSNVEDLVTRLREPFGIALHLQTTQPRAPQWRVPGETALSQNYPNPLNPETWIPYHLSNDADVQISIYDTKGVLVRRLDLGYQSAGYYSTRSKAAYWDGRNERGESVASGLYFYHLRAGDYTAVRRMVILK